MPHIYVVVSIMSPV